MAFCVHPSSLSLSSSVHPVSVWAVRYCSYIQVYVSEPGTCTDQPCIYTAAPFRLQEHGEHSLLWGLGCPTEGCRKKDGWSEGWMGGALAWHQSQFGIGCCPGNGTSDLIYPLAHRTPYVHSALAHAHFFCRTLSPSLFSAWELKLFFLCPFFPSHSLRVWPPPYRAGEGLKSEHLKLREGIVSEATFTVFLVVFGRKEKRAIDCVSALLSIYIVDSNFIPPEKSLESLF